ncbi:hypothetical protein C2E21_4363 [Chlorella sorokiniana]|uniref:Uncharacterized protein n=1 Tax=Chlorella sorokiniana TaxID=3076 RepID=A0A2P6TTV4_CHLSO|nr:hypothetical protein C2E21_4363 [Chlorella sorokiniana]PRW57485.1 hypothetical protein C2E21_4363 [Chlorella sorokiniana]|eukprot:PRW57484.1 hypothetical protein C2E21_4363 [Chlorella sorokiniana]
MRPTTFAFAISAFLACAGTCIVLGAVASVQQLCTEAPNGYYPTNLGGDVTCSAFMSLYWVTWALQVFFLLCVSLSAATQSIHTYKSTLAAQGAVASAPAYHRAWAYLIGQAIALSGTLLMLFTGDAIHHMLSLHIRLPRLAVLGGVGSLQYHCEAGTALQGARTGTHSCRAALSLPWTVWALQVLFLAATAVALFKKQIHNFRSSLWSLAAVTTAVSCYMAYHWFYLVANNVPGAEPRSSTKATLAGFCITCAGDFLLMLVGDYMYRLKHVQGQDGFVSMRRPGPFPKEQPAGSGVSLIPRRPLDWAFLASIVISAAGTVIALGGLGSAQSSCSPDSLAFRGAGTRCSTWLSFEWWAIALQIFVLAATLAARTTSYVHAYKNSLWILAAVVTIICVISCNQIYFAWQWSTGDTHTGLVVALYGLSILVAGNYLLMATGDALHQLKREEGADGFITFRRPNYPAPASEPKPDNKV